MTHCIRRVAGVATVLLAVVPLYRWLPSRDSGLAGRSTAEIVAVQTELLWSGFLLLVLLALLAALFVPPEHMDRVTTALGRAILRPSNAAFAWTTAVTGTVVTAATSTWVFEHRPNLVDAILQLTHARYFAKGELGGPPAFADGFWHMQNALVTADGWFSQYPPGHIALLAAGFAVGAVWMIGPLLMGATAGLTTLVMARLFPDRPLIGRISALATALSPFLIAHAATYMNHASAALLGVTAVYCAFRALRGAAAWAAIAGSAVAALAAVRPLTAIVMMVVVTIIWVQRDDEIARAKFRRVLRLGSLASAGGLPLVAAQLWYNAAAFGHFLTFGYDAAWGPSHGLGFHRDPWGNTYGPVEALLYTSADLSALNLNLLETLLPHVAIVGLFLAVAPRLTRGERVLAAWALLPVLANAFYWHHGQFMGPRMLAEHAPAWVALAVASLFGLAALVPAGARLGGRLSARAVFPALAIAAAVAFVVMAPQRLQSYGGDWLPGFRSALPQAPPQSIVFVHGAWETRIMSRLAARGIRLDHVETAMRQNATCAVHRHLLRLATDTLPFGAAGPGLPALDLQPGSREHHPRVLVGRDARVRVDTTVPLHRDCLAELRADRFGAVDASFMLWLGDLPGIEEGRPMFARDLGPTTNQRLLARYPGRRAWLYGYFAEDDSLRLVPYEQAAAWLYGAR